MLGNKAKFKRGVMRNVVKAKEQSILLRIRSQKGEDDEKEIKAC